MAKNVGKDTKNSWFFRQLVIEKRKKRLFFEKSQSFSLLSDKKFVILGV
jgi:hypothetical protein